MGFWGIMVCVIGIVFLLAGVVAMRWSGDSSNPDSVEKYVFGLVSTLFGALILLVYVVYALGAFESGRVTESEKVESSSTGDAMGYANLATYDEYKVFSNVYVAYRAYDDGKFSDSEIDRLSGVPFDYRLKDAIDTGELSDSEALAYEDEVNNMIDNVDPSDGKLVFKGFVLSMEFDELLSVMLDGQLDERERELIGFAGDVLDRDVTNVISDLERFVDSGVDSVESYEDLISGLDDEFGYFDVSKIKYVSDREDRLFRVKK